MVTVSCQKIVGCALEGVGCFFDDGVDFVLGLDCEAVQDFALERSSGRYSSGWCVVDAC